MAYRDRFVDKYLDPIDVEAKIAEVVQSFGDLCRLETLPFMSHGYQGTRVDARGRHAMRVLRITAPCGSQKPAIFLMRSHHAREWINALAVVETARQLVENYRPADDDPRVQRIVTILDKVEVLIVPEANPDGARLSFFDPGWQMWRKNLRPSDAGTCPGVDCNRNFSRYWGERGSSDQFCSETYRGPAPLSEPEVANIAYLTETCRNIVFAIDSHSHGQALYRPTAAGGTFVSSLPVTPEDEQIFRHLEETMNRFIRSVQGVQYSVGSTSNHAGTSDEFLFFERQIFGFDMECGRQFQPAFPEALVAALEVAEAVKALGWCAAGQTGLDIPELVRRRQRMVPDTRVESPRDELPAEPWTVSSLPPERWRRFLVECATRRPVNALQEYLALQERGFDVDLADHPGILQLVASGEDISALLDLGYTPSVVADLLARRDDNGNTLQDAPGAGRH